MTIKEILRFPDPQLKTKAAWVEDFSDVAELATDLQDAATENLAEGLAATQIGVHRRAFVVKLDGKYEVCFNPVILGMSSTLLLANEGCLSFPGVYEDIKRAATVDVAYQDTHGELVQRSLVAVEAVAFQHELDHLNGVLFIDHMGKLQKHLAKKQLKKFSKRT